MWETWVPSLGWEDPLEKGKATHSSILVWRVPWNIQSPWGRKESDTTERLSLRFLSCLRKFFLSFKAKCRLLHKTTLDFAGIWMTSVFPQWDTQGPLQQPGGKGCSFSGMNSQDHPSFCPGLHPSSMMSADHLASSQASASRLFKGLGEKITFSFHKKVR